MQARFAIKLSVAALATAGLLALGGCNETDRPLSYKKGVYGGKTDQKLTAQQLETLRQRGTLQN
ncbi:MAG: hypothetical protein VX871_11180 [Pseudomonadota bacterium]|nr:hypothetical protein [Pseudomonadota bacterium]